jgi:hypothetical protein
MDDTLESPMTEKRNPNRVESFTAFLELPVNMSTIEKSSSQQLKNQQDIMMIDSPEGSETERTHAEALGARDSLPPTGNAKVDR